MAKTPARAKKKAQRLQTPEDRLHVAILLRDETLADLSDDEVRRMLLKGSYPERLIAIYLAVRPWKKSVVLRSDLVIDTARAGHAAALYNGAYQLLREAGWWEERAEPTQFWPEGEPKGHWRHADPGRAGSFDMLAALHRIFRDEALTFASTRAPAKKRRRS